MKKIASVVFVLLCSLLLSQEYIYSDSKSDEPTSSAPLVPLFGYKAVYVTFFTFLGEANSMKMDLTYAQTDPSNAYPVIFTVLDESGNEVMIRDYMQQNSLTSISYYDLIENGVQDYYKKITNKKLDLDVVFLKNPVHSKGVWEVDSLRSWYKFLSDSVGNGVDVYKNHMIQKLKNCGIKWISDLADAQSTLNETVFLNFMAVPIKPGVSGVAPGNDSYNFMGNYIQQMVAILAHELAHTTLAVGDMGYSGISSYYNGYIDEKFMGYAGSQTGPYCFMFHNGGQLSPYALNAIQPIHTQLLYHQGYFDNQDYVSLNDNFVFKDEMNKANLRLKSVRDELTGGDLVNDTKRFAILPITTDLKDPLDIPTRTSSGVEAQHFLIEYRNGKGYDNIACLGESGNSKGILISHINNADYTAGNYYTPNIDIEIATPYPKYWSNGVDLYRDPDSTSYRKVYVSPGVYDEVYDEVMNGTNYNGRECPDWLDDYNYNPYLPQGGPGAWPSSFGENSLPSDFFNDTDRNKFTPSTRPSSISFKMQDTHIGVYVDHIEDYYADLRIYRNYFSEPITKANAVELAEGKSGITILGYGYIGENFSVDGGCQLWLGDGTSNSRTTLVPSTDMHLKSNALLELKENTILQMESSVLTLDEGSIFQPFGNVVLNLEGSEMTFKDGVIYNSYNYVDSYNISVTGNSAFSKTSFDFIGASRLTLNEGSKFTVKAGTNFNLSALSEITLKNGSELVIEDGAFLNYTQGAKIIVEGNAKITGELGQTYAVFFVTDNSQLTFAGGSVQPMLPAALNAGVNSEIRIGLDSHFIYGQYLVSVLSEGSKIVIENGGYFNGSKANITGSYDWYGIVADIGSEVDLGECYIKNAVWGIEATAAILNVYKATFDMCRNGASLTNCSDFILTDNTFTGRNENIGIGIRLISTNGKISYNTVQNYAHGIVAILCSPNIFKNTIKDNVTNGIYLTGNNTYPEIIDWEESKVIQNNLIAGNGINPNENTSQIKMIYPSNAYLYNGLNNIYYTNSGSQCIRTSYFDPVNQMKSIVNPVVRIPAINNYWGTSLINDINYDWIFELWRPDLYQGYGISYEPYAVSAYPEDGGLPRETLYSTLSNSGIMLEQAIKAELDGKTDLAIKKYNHIIDKYSDSEESYIATTRLTDLLVELQKETNLLMSFFDSQINSGNATINKKFYKEMKVAASIKNKNYEDAITFAEEIKSEAQTENDVILADIDIAIANKMKKAYNSKNSDVHDPKDFNELLSKLIGDDDKSYPADLAESVLPSEIKLHQNYPNPFNPVTRIRFDLSKSTNVKLSVYNVNGQIVSELANGVLNAGKHTIEFDGSRLNSGVYYYTLETEGKSLTQKMVLMK